MVNHHKPLAYVLGTQPFHPLPVELIVRPPTLVPRPETEHWVLHLSETISSSSAFARDATSTSPAPFRILDIGTGTGCIVLGLVQALSDRANPSTSTGSSPNGSGLDRSTTVQGVAVDRSESAVDLARENASRCGLEEQVVVEVGDVFDDRFVEIVRRGAGPVRGDDSTETDRGFDLVVSNPPYVTRKEYAELDPSVRDWEDRGALVGERRGGVLGRGGGDETGANEERDEDDGLVYYRRITLILDHLLTRSSSSTGLCSATDPSPRSSSTTKPAPSPPPCVAFEVGSKQARSVAALLRDKGYSAEIRAPALSLDSDSLPFNPGLADQAVSSVSPGDKYIGLALAISSSVAIGTSFIITKKGLISAADQHDGFSSDSYSYLKNGLWWAGMLTIANFAAYTFAPPVLVTPLGALSVLIGAVLAAFFLGERLGRIGVSGCALCLVGSIIIVLHSPEDKEIATVDEILDYALQPGFMFYCLVVLCYSLYAIYRIAPKYGTSNPLVYISICSLVGSVSVMAVKGFGVALKLTFAGNNQLWRAGTWIFAVTVVGCIAVQMNYFNKALDLFPTTVVNPSYFVGFSSCTLLASIILFHGLNTTGGANTLSLLCGLFVICLGVYLLNLSRSENESIASRRHSNGTARHSLLESGMSRHSLGGASASGGGGGAPGGGGRLSMASDSDDLGGTGGGRRSTGMYRGGGAVMGGVEPLFDYDQAGASSRHGGGAYGESLHMERFAIREEEDDDESGDEGGYARRSGANGKLGGAAGGGGMTR
ncbi:hypothetical protein JCM10212_000951 [Sporobolomyces blumeae]